MCFFMRDISHCLFSSCCSYILARDALMLRISHILNLLKMWHRIFHPFYISARPTKLLACASGMRILNAFTTHAAFPEVKTTREQHVRRKTQTSLENFFHMPAHIVFVFVRIRRGGGGEGNAEIIFAVGARPENLCF